MSHLDNLRMMERAIRRARIPISYSQGYNPTMKLSLGPPLPLGFTSEAEYVDITLETSLMPYMVESLKRALPEGVDLLEARGILSKSPSLSSVVNRVVYELPLSSWADASELREQIEALLREDTLECERATKKDTKIVNIRPSIYEILICGDRLELILGLGEGGYAKPTEVISFLTRGLNVDAAALIFHRRAIYRQEKDGRRTDAMDL
jgi:radical SAM-linked protein